MTANSPTFPEMLRGAFNAQLADMHVALPAQVVAYDPALQSVDVQPLIRRGYTDEQGQRAVERMPVVTHVPVAFPGAGAISMTWPIATGSTGILLFCEASLDKWLNEGGDVDPLDDRRFALSDGMFIPGLRPFSDPVPSSGVHSSAVVIQAPLIHAGGTEALALKSDVDELRTRFNAHIVLASGALGHTLTTSAPVGTLSGTSVLKGS